MRVRVEEWRRYPTEQEWAEIVKEGPGVRIYKDKMTLFYNGEKLYDDDLESFLFMMKKSDILLKSSSFYPEEIGNGAFYDCTKLIIFSVPQQTRLGETVITNTALVRASPFETVLDGYYANQQGRVHEWIKNINQGGEYDLHRACSSFTPLKEIIYGIVKRNGPSSFKKRNEIEMTPFDYLEANPFVRHELDQRALMKQYVLEMMGETM